MRLYILSSTPWGICLLSEARETYLPVELAEKFSATKKLGNKKIDSRLEVFTLRIAVRFVYTFLTIYKVLSIIDHIELID